jgi:hypothetical protein
MGTHPFWNLLGLRNSQSSKRFIAGPISGLAKVSEEFVVEITVSVICTGVPVDTPNITGVPGIPSPELDGRAFQQKNSANQVPG